MKKRIRSNLDKTKRNISFWSWRKRKEKREEEEEEKRRKKEGKKKITGMELFSFGIESMDTWFGTLYFVYGLGLETPKLISC